VTTRPVEFRDLYDFLNTRDERTFGVHAAKVARDSFASRGSLDAWLRSRNLAVEGDQIAEADRTAFVALRDALRSLVADRRADRTALTKMAIRYPVVVSFETEPVLRPAKSGASGILASLLTSAAEAAIDGRWSRLKMCDAPDCRFVFYDRGRNGLGRWCATEICGSRMKARRYRRRHAKRRATESEAAGRQRELESHRR
jgi:predicted RNA-binding Zn ribbon-like protein